MKEFTFSFISTAIALALAVLLSLTGCAQWFSCSTEASYNTDGSWSYKSCKNQENFKGLMTKDATGNQSVEVETTATTAESAIIAASKGLTAAFDALSKITSILEKAAMTGGS